jgi:hypothetical protein
MENMTTIHMVVSSDDESCVTFIPRLPNLINLKMIFSADRMPVFDGVSPLFLPNVLSIALLWPGKLKRRSALRFLCGCRLPSARIMKIEYPNIHYDSVIVTTLVGFPWDSYTRLSTLTINLDPSFMSNQFVTEALWRAARRLEITSHLIPPSLLETWSVDTIKETPLTSTITGDYLWPFLNRLAEAVGTVGPRAFEVHISLNDSRFTWDCADDSDEHAHFVGKILRHAIILQKQGVSVFDEDGNTLLPRLN